MDYIDLAGDKELVFSVGGQEVTATIGADQSIRFDNLAHLALLEAEDFLTMRLYTNNDAGNVLWEYVLFTPGEIVVKNDAGDEAVEEICLSNRVNLRKRYHIELPDMPPSYDLKKLHGHIRVVDREGKVVTVPASGSPGDTKYAAVEYPLEFVREGERVCAVIKVDENETRGRCIFTNLALDIIADDDDDGYYYADQDQTAMMYGGVGGRVQIDVNITRHEVPMEPLGVIVIGIDGLRRDVLYPGVNLPDGDYHIGDLSVLPGIGGIMAGHEAEESRRYVMLDNVTAIFPSITLASWASIFTGRMPAETGIMGNEFFARDLLEVGVSEPARFKNPPGIISFSSGAFMGYDQIFPKEDDFFIPYQFSWSEPVEPGSVPQNKFGIMPAETVFEQIGSMEGVTRYFQDTNGNSVVVAYSHYARGAYWLTWDLEAYWEFCNEFPFVRPDESEILDKTSWDKLDDYLCGKYRDYLFRRNDTPFSALTVWYIPGLDHEAHIKGMGIYNEYLTDTIDPLISKFTDRLIGLDEFDNKLFIIVSDHGMTGMLESSQMNYVQYIKDENGTVLDQKKWPGYDSCKLQYKDFNSDKKRYPELANNNLHIWELAEGFKWIEKENSDVSYRVLAPREIADLYMVSPAGARSDLEEANVIAAFNGPMAHIYFKGSGSWSTQPGTDDQVELRRLAEVFRVLYQEEVLQEAADVLGIDQISYLKLREEKSGRLQSSIDRILIREGGVYKEFKGYGSSQVTSDISLSDAYIQYRARIEGLNNPDRSGDIILIMRDKTEEHESQRFTCGVACKAWHGGLNPGDSYVPFILAYPGGNAVEVERLREGIGNCPEDGSYCEECACGNWKVTGVIMQVIQKQYGQ
jgi:predicted AlkP superfamily pyrophosphatase or phosphodiesterase